MYVGHDTSLFLDFRVVAKAFRSTSVLRLGRLTAPR